MAERFIIFSSKDAFNAGSDKYDNNSIVFVKDSVEPAIYTHAFGWVSLPNNAVADQILSFVEGKAKWIDKDYYNKSEIDTKIDEIDVTDQLADYAKSADVTTEISDAVDSAKAELEAKIDGVYDKDEIDSKLTAVKSEILGGAGEYYDTLKEIEQWISEHKDLYDALIAATATKEYVDGKIEDLAEVYQPKGEYLTEHQSLEGFYTKEEVDAMWEWGEY